jgi:hypothetical protein
MKACSFARPLLYACILALNTSYGDALVFARMRAALAGQEGAFVEGHQLNAKTIKKMSKKIIKRTLKRKEAARLLKQLT